jgi:hypothetical protein
MKRVGTRALCARLMMAALLVSFSLCVSCATQGDQPPGGGPTGPGGGEGTDCPPIRGVLTVDPSSHVLTVPIGNPGGEIVYYEALGGRAPYFWTNTVPSIGHLTPIDECGDGSFRRCKYTVASPLTMIGDDTIVIRDSAGNEVSATFTLSLSARK